MILTQINLKNILVGSTFLGTGGGGRIDKANLLMRKIEKIINLVDIESIKSNDMIFTSYGIGNLKQAGNPFIPNKNNLILIKKFIKKPVKYLIPVEIGPVSVMNIFLISNYLNIPVIDGDLVGFRASPEIYLETITLGNINRLPIVSSNSNGDSIVIYKTSSIKRIETILRDFSSSSVSKTYVMGYPMKKNQIQNIFGNKSITYTLKIGSILSSGKNIQEIIEKLNALEIQYISSGTIIKQTEFKVKGFTAGKLLIQSKKDVFEIVYKNEYLVLIKNDRIILTCPDSILLLDEKSLIGIINSENNKNKNVMIFIKKSIPIWRTRKGLKLFSPKNIGLNYSQKLL